MAVYVEYAKQHGHNNTIVGTALSPSYYIYHDQMFITCFYTWWQYSEIFQEFSKSGEVFKLIFVKPLSN